MCTRMGISDDQEDSVGIALTRSHLNKQAKKNWPARFTQPMRGSRAF